MSCAVPLILLACWAVDLPQSPASAPAQALRATGVEAVNQAFRAWLDENPATLAGDRVILADVTGEETNPHTFVEDALCTISPPFAQALRHYDEGNLPEALAALEPLQGSDNPFLAMLAQYYVARVAVAQGRLEEAEELLGARFADWSTVARFTVKAPHARLLLAHCQAANLRFDQAANTLRDLLAEASQLPESVAVGARQLSLELERRERGTLAEAAGLMGYSQRRLAAGDGTDRVQKRQAEIIELLDKLIQDAQQKESKSRGGRGGQGSPQGGRQNTRPSTPLEESRVQRGAGEMGDLHTSPRAQPGEVWGKLPPAEREKILERLREKYPSRYRQLVEQYYRSLAGENK